MVPCWEYEWNHVYTPTYSAYSTPWQVVNNVRSKITGTWDIIVDDDCPLPVGNHFDPPVQNALQACVGNIAAARPGMYWMLWNEPDQQHVPDSDNISPSLAISYFVVISNTILKRDPTARLIVGNVAAAYATSPADKCAWSGGCGVFWLSRFITEGHTIGITVTDFIAGYGFHAYPATNDLGIGGTDSCKPNDIFSTATDACLLTNFTLTVKTAKDWVNQYDPGKELWLSEYNWTAFVEGSDTAALQVGRMGQMCDQLRNNWPVTRSAWLYLPHTVATPYSKGVQDLWHPDTGAISDSGVRYRTC